MRLQKYKLFFDLKSYHTHICKDKTYKDWILLYTDRSKMKCQVKQAVAEQNIMAFEKLFITTVTKLTVFTFSLGWYFVSLLWALPITLLTFLFTNFLAHLLLKKSLLKRQAKVKCEQVSKLFEDYTSYHEVEHTNSDNLMAIVGGVLFLGLVLLVNLLIFGSAIAT